MNIGGLQKVSLIDYPGRISAVLFAQGCNFRCPYCHNPELVDPGRYGETIPEEEVLAFLDRRVGKLDAVVISGGEPTLQTDLIPFVESIRERGYLVKLDTNGSRPEMLRELIDAGFVDHVAMDIKGPLERYARITGSDIRQERILQSIEMINSSKIPHEFRTTITRTLLQDGDLDRIVRLIHPSRSFVLQAFVPFRILDQAFLREAPFSPEELEQFRREIEKVIPRVLIR